MVAHVQNTVHLTSKESFNSAGPLSKPYDLGGAPSERGFPRRDLHPALSGNDSLLSILTAL